MIRVTKVVVKKKNVESDGFNFRSSFEINTQFLCIRNCVDEPGFLKVFSYIFSESFFVRENILKTDFAA